MTSQICVQISVVSGVVPPRLDVFYDIVPTAKFHTESSQVSFETTRELYASAPNIAHLLKKLSKAYMCLSYYSHHQLLSHLKQSYIHMYQLLLSYYSHWQLLKCCSCYSKKTPSVP